MIIRGIIWDLVTLGSWVLRYAFTSAAKGETNSVNIANNSGNPGKTGSTSGNDANVFISILAILSLAVSMIIEASDSLTKS